MWAEGTQNAATTPSRNRYMPPYFFAFNNLHIDNIFRDTSFRFRLLTNPVTITGHLKNNPKDNSAFVDRVMVFVKGDNKILAKVLTDEKGNFKITFVPQKIKSFDFYCTGLGIDTFLIASVTTFESDTPDMTFYIPGQVKRNALGKVLCPICKRTDKVYKIQYGDAPVMTRHISKAGLLLYLDERLFVNCQTLNDKSLQLGTHQFDSLTDIRQYFAMPHINL